MTQSFWNKSVHYFNPTLGGNDFHKGIADNVLIAWPVMMDFAEKFTPQKEMRRVLDYGCGPGDLCHRLSAKNFDVTGIDFSEAMIEIAKKKYGKEISFYLGDSKKAKEIAAKNGKFDCVLASMVFQFIENIEEVATDITNSLSEDGVLCFAVHHRDWIQACMDTHNPLSQQPPNTTGIDQLMIELMPGQSVKTFNRSAETYNKLFGKLGFKKILEEYPPFTPEWIEKYHDNDEPVDIPQFMILGYKKSANQK